MLEVEAYKLEEWSRTYPAKAELPLWIARLIHASCDGLTKLDMPGGEHGHLAGFDGIVECSSGDDMVPTGISAWEISVDGNIRTKANGDFEKRNENPGHLRKPDVTFVFATTRKWGNADEWVRERMGSDWRGIKVLWSSHFARWFERFPWLATEFLESIGEGPVGLESFEMIWTGYERIAAAGGPLDSDFVLASRTAASDHFLRWLHSVSPGSNRVVRISGGSHREVRHFLIASLHDRSEAERRRWEARLFAVHTEEAARALGRLSSSHVVLAPPGPVLGHVLQTQKRSGCSIVIVDDTPADGRTQPNPGIECIHLGPAIGDVRIRCLIKAGFTVAEAEEMYRRSGGEYERLRKAAFLC